MSNTSPGSLNARKLARRTIPGFVALDGAIVAAPLPVAARSSTTMRRIAIAASIVAPQGHAITVALRAVLARRALVTRTSK